MSMMIWIDFDDTCLSKGIQCHVWPYSSYLANHPSKHQATSNMGSQLVISDDYINLPQEFVWIFMG